ncbi:helix-turn-helix domain-containing protein [Kibdelosporangium persicum]|uniref:Anaerobic benzoate catabolism transcriptional regulator n=1 Tax=Kibdelosporangium persicum TaxID=2698649 RepID=A0ABX2EVN1_9PSEU|nr:XRE family transcriptional regulator [Kibdelosporangium persicum]NRN63027.1 Anaerobic benzoate catabolism transcriptional regulator [Kibdelosporangium persicum]
MDLTETLAEVGPRLKRVRTERGVTLTELATVTGISKSTLSRLESGLRKPSLELLLPIAQAHQVPLDELVGAPEVGDPRVRIAPRRVRQRDGKYVTVLPLTRQPGGLQAYKMILPADRCEPNMVTHEGYEWLYVLSGQLRMMLADKDIVLRVGEAAEFDTRLPHWFGTADGRPVEILSLFGRQGEKMHVRARPKQ